MTFSAPLEKRFARMLASYPVKRSALVPMLMYAQDEVGSLTDEVIEEIARRLDVTVQVRQPPFQIIQGAVDYQWIFTMGTSLPRKIQIRIPLLT